MITLYRAPLLQEMRDTGVGLEDVVNDVVIHHSVHHIVVSDDAIERSEDEGNGLETLNSVRLTPPHAFR